MRQATLLALALCLVGCARPRLVTPLRYAAIAPTPDEPFRGVSPPCPSVSERVDPEPRITTLPNGLRVLLFERHDFPILAATLVIDRSSLDLGDNGGVQVGQTTFVYGRGGSEAAFEALSSDSARTGTSYGGDAGRSAVLFAARGPSEELDMALDMLARVGFRAQLTPEEYHRRAVEWNDEAKHDRVSLHAAERLVLFGDASPYGFMGRMPEMISLPTAETIHQRLFQPAQSSLIVVGDVVPEQLDASVARSFGAWAAGATLSRTLAPLPSREGPRLSIVANHGVTQTYGSVFARGPDPTSDDLVAFSVVRNLLGGGRSSKLHERLRDETGATYDIGAKVNVEVTASWLSVAAAYDAARVVEGIGEVLLAVRGLRSGDVTDEEVAVAREQVLSTWRESLATVGGAATTYAAWLALGVGPDRVRDLVKQVMRVGRDDVVRVANRYLTDGALHVVLLGEDRWLDTRPLGLGGPTKLDLYK